MNRAKRPRLDPVEEAITAIEAMQVDRCAIYLPDNARLPPLVDTLRTEIRPGSGLAGTREEEAALDQQQKLSKETSQDDPGRSQSTEFANGERQHQHAKGAEPDMKSLPKEEETNEEKMNEEGTKEEENEEGTKEEESDDESIEGVEHDLTDIVILPDGDLMHVAQYFGSEYAQRIVGQLVHLVRHQVRVDTPVEKPPRC
jgi:hypothetical protein